jgi:hypothetical protein
MDRRLDGFRDGLGAAKRKIPVHSHYLHCMFNYEQNAEKNPCSYSLVPQRRDLMHEFAFVKVIIRSEHLLLPLVDSGT